MEVIVVLLAVTVFACRMPAAKDQPANISAPIDHSPSKPRLRVQTLKSETSIYQDKFVIASPVIVAGDQVPGKHTIDLWNSASYKGTTPRCDARSLTIMIRHEKPERSGWQFPKSASVIFLVDGKQTRPVKVNQQDLELEDGTYWESLITQPSCETLSLFRGAQSGEIQISDARIPLTPRDIEAFVEFASAIGL